MKIKKSFLAILAVLTLFGASASTSISAFTSVEANAATHHKNVKKHKKAKKSSKKHKKATKKSKKKATKKHSKKKVAKKHKRVTHKKKATKKVIKKKPVKKHIKKSNGVHRLPTLDINPEGTDIQAEYTNKQSKDYDNLDITDKSAGDQYDIKLRNITYYQLSGDKYKTAVVLKLYVENRSDNNKPFFDTGLYGYGGQVAGVYLSNNAGNQLLPAWGGQQQYAALIPQGSHQVVTLTFAGTDASTPADFSDFTFNYNVGYNGDVTFGPTLNF